MSVMVNAMQVSTVLAPSLPLAQSPVDPFLPCQSRGSQMPYIGHCHTLLSLQLRSKCKGASSTELVHPPIVPIQINKL